MNKPKERPVLMSAPMVRAILAGEKTQTRRESNLPLPISEHQPLSWHWDEKRSLFSPFGAVGHIKGKQKWGVKCPYGMPGDRLWVRETFYNDIPSEQDTENIYYRADASTNKWCCELIPECQCATVGKPKLTPSIFMPRWASRILLEVTDIRIERRDSISEADAAAEGVAHVFKKGILTSKQAFRVLWERINGEKSLKVNPWVWVVGFKVLEDTDE